LCPLPLASVSCCSLVSSSKPCSNCARSSACEVSALSHCFGTARSRYHTAWCPDRSHPAHSFRCRDRAIGIESTIEAIDLYSLTERMRNEFTQILVQTPPKPLSRRSVLRQSSKTLAATQLNSNDRNGLPAERLPPHLTIEHSGDQVTADIRLIAPTCSVIIPCFRPLSAAFLVMAAADMSDVW